MRLAVSILGTEVFALEVGSSDQQTDGGDSTTYPIGFTAQHGDQRWQPGGEP